MSANFDIKYLQPFKGKHSVTEVIFSVYLANPIINPERFGDLVKKGGGLFENFQNFKLLTGVKLDVKFTPQGTEPVQHNLSKTGNDGFSIEKFKDGKLSWLINYQPSNSPDRKGDDLLKIHCLDYEDWHSFFEESISLLKTISAFEDLYISGFSLYYLDQFYWNDVNLPEMECIFKKGSPYLPQLLFDAKSTWNFISNISRTINQRLIAENTNIGSNVTLDKRYTIYLFHNASNIFDQFKKLSQLINETADLKTLANDMHTSNKDFLKQTLTSDVQKAINLN